MSRRTVLGVLAGALVLALAVSGARLVGWLGGDDPEALRVTADFADTTGVYVGNDVTYLGVEVGEIVEVEPRGTTMRVVMHLDPRTRVPEDAGAEILQGSLVTDRFIEIGPAWDGGPTLASGAHIDAAHTRSPATVDEVAKAIDDLVLALDAGLDGKGGAGLGEMLSTTAAALEGNGAHLRRALAESRDALEVVNAKEADLTAVSENLVELVTTLGRRDKRIRDFTTATADTTAVLADQREELVATLDALDELTRLTNTILTENAEVLGDDLAGLADVVGTVREHQDSLAEAFDVMPTMAENFARAYDWDLGRLRVQFAFSAGPFSAAFRSHTCNVFAAMAGELGTDMCGLLFTTDGRGLLDPLLDGIYDGLPGGIP
ncbi:phospholipid/cholesterol/gamma-HCH transport system substrate-binding protein [Nocardioides sp. J9]|uniref:MCE family protein n=1 Tax=unclassified Nocardioides TaxID=2615069 RepID=UPI0004B39AA4|nr:MULTISPECIES: MCE family protein [unclassified Nocardioides]TWH00692.1 phospholipid/cholesterol/gamma-HCH transport system substrate-binding protein [Nocardioides sp. J9]